MHFGKFFLLPCAANIAVPFAFDLVLRVVGLPSKLNRLDGVALKPPVEYPAGDSGLFLGRLGSVLRRCDREVHREIRRHPRLDVLALRTATTATPITFIEEKEENGSRRKSQKS